VVQYAIAGQLGPELPNLIAGGVVMIIFIMWEKVRAPLPPPRRHAGL
jgi:L-lactate permease